MKKNHLVRTIAATALITLAATTAQAARTWQHLGTDGKNNHFMYEKRTTKRNGDIVSGWVNKQYNVDEAVMKEKKFPLNQYHGKTWTMAFYEFNCKEGTMRVMVGKEQLGDKKVQDINRGDWQPPQQKSLDESLLNAICKEFPEQKTP